ncbi:PKD domain-containing protein, partial [Thermodesulfobacteriota bacterium]
NVSADPGTITVPDDYPTIQEAVTAAGTGDTVYVRAGTYYENVNIGKELTLQGEEKETTIIDGGGSGNVILITVNSVTVKDLTVTNSGSNTGYTGDAGIRIDNADDCVIENIKVVDNNGTGINLVYADYCWVKDSYIANNGLGIFLWRGTYNEYSHNYIFNNPGNGIQLADSGLYGSNWVHDNELIENGLTPPGAETAAIFLWGSGSRNNVIENNFCDKNKQGIHFRAYGISGNIIRGNTFQNSTECAVRYTHSAGPDIFYHNNFIKNTSELSGYPLSPNTWDDGYPSGGNYWDTYTGTDNYNGPTQDIPGADGIGDTAYAFGGWGTDNYPLMSPWSLNNPPVADAGGPYEADEGSEITFDASGSNDPDEDELQYRWDFENDGIWDTDYSPDPMTTVPYDNDLVGEITVEVFDGELTNTATASITIHNVAPTVSLIGVTQPNPGFILPGDALGFTGSFTDPGTLDTHSITWDFGDGTIATGTMTPVHLYTTPGNYTVTVTVTDNDGGLGSDTIAITVDTPESAVGGISENLENLEVPADAPAGVSNQYDLAMNSLQAAQDSLDSGQPSAALSNLASVVRRLSVLEDQIAGADAIIDQIITLTDTIITERLEEAIQNANTFPERIFLRIGNSMLDRAQRSAAIDRDSSAMALYSVTYRLLDRIR